MASRDDVTTYRPTVTTVIGRQLAGWLSADMTELAELVDATDPDLFGHGELADATRRLAASLASKLDAS